MGIERNIGWTVVGAALVSLAAPCMARPSDRLIVTTLPDPELNLVPLSQPDYARTQATGPANEAAKIDRMIENFGRVLGEASMVEREQVEDRCKVGEPEDATARQRTAWQIACRYSRH